MSFHQDTKTKKHHFIPQYMLKKFYNENDEFYVLFKDRGVIKHQTSAQNFYKENFHTINLFGERTDIIEQLHSKVEGAFSKLYDLFEEFPEAVNSFDIMSLGSEVKVFRLLILSMLWRRPAAESYVDIYSDKIIELFKSNPSDIIPEGLTLKFIKYLHKKRNKENIKKLIQHMLLPIISTKLDAPIPNDLKWLIIKTPEDFRDKLMMGDNFFSDGEFPEIINLNSEFSFPISKNTFFVSTRSNIIDFMGKNYIEDMQRKTYLNSKEKIICALKEELEHHLNYKNDDDNNC